MSSLCVEYPADGRTEMDFHRSVLAYLDWRIARGRPEYRQRVNPEYQNLIQARSIVVDAFRSIHRPMHVAGSVDAEKLSACIADWPEDLRELHYRKQDAAKKRLLAATAFVMNRKSSSKRSVLRTLPPANPLLTTERECA